MMPHRKLQLLVFRFLSHPPQPYLSKAKNEDDRLAVASLWHTIAYSQWANGAWGNDCRTWESRWPPTQTVTRTALEEPGGGPREPLGLLPPLGWDKPPGGVPGWEPGLDTPGSANWGCAPEICPWTGLGPVAEESRWNSGGGGRCIQLYCLFSTGTPHLSNSMYCFRETIRPVFININNWKDLQHQNPCVIRKMPALPDLSQPRSKLELVVETENIAKICHVCH